MSHRHSRYKRYVHHGSSKHNRNTYHHTHNNKPKRFITVSDQTIMIVSDEVFRRVMAEQSYNCLSNDYNGKKNNFSFHNQEYNHMDEYIQNNRKRKRRKITSNDNVNVDNSIEEGEISLEEGEVETKRRKLNDIMYCKENSNSDGYVMNENKSNKEFREEKTNAVNKRKHDIIIKKEQNHTNKNENTNDSLDITYQIIK
eukprot:373478_1